MVYRVQQRREFGYKHCCHTAVNGIVIASRSKPSCGSSAAQGERATAVTSSEDIKVAELLMAMKHAMLSTMYSDAAIMAQHWLVTAIGHCCNPLQHLVPHDDYVSACDASTFKP